MSSNNACVYLRRPYNPITATLADQREALMDYARDRGFNIVAEFIDRGDGFGKPARPAFYKMTGQALSEDRSFGTILVYRMSHLFRDDIRFRLYRQEVAANDVMVVSITEPDDTLDRDRAELASLRRILEQLRIELNDNDFRLDTESGQA